MSKSIDIKLSMDYYDRIIDLLRGARIPMGAEAASALFYTAFQGFKEDMGDAQKAQQLCLELVDGLFEMSRATEANMLKTDADISSFIEAVLKKQEQEKES